MKALSGRTKAFNSSLCPYSIKEWCSLREEIRNIVSVNKFRKIILCFIRNKENSVFAVHDTKVLKLLTRLRLNFSRLNEHKSRHGFWDTVDPMWKKKQHFTFFCVAGCILLIDEKIYYPDEKLRSILLQGSEFFSVKTSQSILKSTIKFLKSSERFDDSLVLYANLMISFTSGVSS